MSTHRVYLNSEKYEYDKKLREGSNTILLRGLTPAEMEHCRVEILPSVERYCCHLHILGVATEVSFYSDFLISKVKAVLDLDRQELEIVCKCTRTRKVKIRKTSAELVEQARRDLERMTRRSEESEFNDLPPGWGDRY